MKTGAGRVMGKVDEVGEQAAAVLGQATKVELARKLQTAEERREASRRYGPTTGTPSAWARSWLPAQSCWRSCAMAVIRILGAAPSLRRPWTGGIPASAAPLTGPS
jgi:hypothetical protein